MSDKRRLTREFTPEFRVQAAQLVLSEGMTVSKAAKDLGIPMGTLHGWVQRFRRGQWSLETGLPPGAIQGKPGASGTTSRTAHAVSEDKKKILDLERQVRRLTMERDILKKAMAYCIDLPK